MKKEEIETVRNAIKEFGDGFWTDQAEVEGTVANDSLFDEIITFVNKAGYDLKLERLQREYTLIPVCNFDDLSPSWKEVATKCQYRFIRGIFADFGLAEECIGILQFEMSDEYSYFEVGIDESLRSYETLYIGLEGVIANNIFMDTIKLHKYL